MLEPQAHTILHVIIPDLGPKLLVSYAATNGTGTAAHHIYHHPNNLSGHATVYAPSRHYNLSTTTADATKDVTFENKIS